MAMPFFLKRCIMLALALPALMATGQPVSSDSIPVKENELTVDFQFLGRGESRYGGLPAVDIDDEDEGETPKSSFLLSRTRLAINYKRSWLQARVTPQHSGVWGQAGKGAFNIYESWVKFSAPFGLFAQLGRVALNYDDERIIGSDDWAMASSSHDVLRLGYEGHGHKAHVILAYNQNADVMNSGGSYYNNGAQPYKTMHTAWYHYDIPKFPLGVSLLFMNTGLQHTAMDKYTDKDRSIFQHLLGGYLLFHPHRWQVSASYYHQFGHNEDDIRINAWMASGKVSFMPRPNYSFTAGYDYLSGDKYFAVPPTGAIGMVRHDVIRGFSTVYGSSHKFYGAMDFFYVSAYLNGFTPGLQNAYIGGQYSPVKGLVINASYHYLAIATQLDDMDKTLGHEVELQASYTIARDVKLSVGGSYMKGSETMERLKRTSNKNTLRWSWISLSVNPRIFSSKW